MNSHPTFGPEPAAAHPFPVVSRRRSSWQLLWFIGANTVVCAAGQPLNDDFTSPAAIIGGAGHVAGNNMGATAQPGEPRHAGESPQASVWWRWIAPSSGQVVFNTIGSHFDTVLAVYTGDTLENLVVVAENDDEYPEEPDSFILGTLFGRQSRVSFQAEAGTPYSIALGGLAGITGNGPATGDISLSWSLELINDYFEDATQLSGPNGVALGDTEFATSQSGERDPMRGISTGASLWWQWTAPSSGPVIFGIVQNEEEDFDTLLTVYQGPVIEELEVVAENSASSDIFLNLDSTVTLDAVEGVIYSITVDGLFGETPDVVLRWSQPPENHRFADAFTIDGVSGVTAGNNIFATPHPWSEPDHGGLPGNASVWWNWTAPATGRFTFNTFGSTFNTILAVYTGEEVWEDGVPFSMLDLALVVDNDDAGDSAQSLVEFEAAAGILYRIAVVNYDPADRGDIVLNWRPDLPLAEPLRIDDLSRLPDGALRFVVRGPPGATGTVFRSRSLDTWEPWKPFSLDGGAMEVNDPDARTTANFFYKAEVP